MELITGILIGLAISLLSIISVAIAPGVLEIRKETLPSQETEKEA